MSVRPVCAPDRLHSVSPCRINHSLAGISLGYARLEQSCSKNAIALARDGPVLLGVHDQHTDLGIGSRNICVGQACIIFWRIEADTEKLQPAARGCTDGRGVFTNAGCEHKSIEISKAGDHCAYFAAKPVNK